MVILGTPSIWPHIDPDASNTRIVSPALVSPSWAWTGVTEPASASASPSAIGRNIFIPLPLQCVGGPSKPPRGLPVPVDRGKAPVDAIEVAPRRVFPALGMPQVLVGPTDVVAQVANLPLQAIALVVVLGAAQAFVGL